MLDFNMNIIYSIPGLLSALIFYVYAQAKVADNLGDPTPRFCGRLTLNPLVHIDIWGFICLLFVHMGWAKPVPINPYNFKNPKKGELEVNLAGPIANFILAFGCTMILRIMAANNALSTVEFSILQNAILYNLVFGFFNLLPIPPLTGARILSSILPYKYAEKIDRIALNPYSYLILLGLMFLGVFSAVIMPLVSIMLYFYNFIADYLVLLVK